MIKDPKKIETRSFEIITEELGEHNFSEQDSLVVKRVIHTTADFEYAKLLNISPDAVSKGIEALKSGCKIYADTNMICSGVNKKRLSEHGCAIYTLVSDEEVSKEAMHLGITRSIVGMQKAMNDPDTKIFVIGNAPTALMTLQKGIEDGIINPDLVIGVPVGFVGAAESKEDFKNVNVPSILVDGRKGGSTIAVAILHAILYQTPLSPPLLRGEVI